MYVIQNALKNVMRNKGRNILIAIIIFAIVGTSVIALIINNTANGIIDKYKQQFGSKVTIELDIEKLMSNANPGGGQNQGGGGGGFALSRDSMELITTDQYIEFSESELLQKTLFTAQTQGLNDDLKAIDEDEEGAQPGGNMIIRTPDGEQQAGSTADFVMPKFVIIGNSDIANIQEFVDGLRFIDEGNGRMYESDNECVISADLAELNEISVGDVINIEASAVRFRGGNDEEDEEENANKIYELTVVGIYTDLTEEYASEMPFASASMNSRNQILTSFETLADTSSEERSNVTVSAEYYLKSPELLEAYQAELAAKGLPDSYKVSTDEASYNTIVAPVEGLKGITLTFMLVVLALGGIILILLSTIAMRERKYEIGVLRAMGMKKGKVAFGLLTEMLVITAFCLVLGLAAGSGAAQPVSDALLAQQLEAIDSANNTNGQNGPFGGMRTGGGGMTGLMRMGAGTDAEPLEDMDISIGFDTMWQIALISLLLAGVASIVGIAHVTRYEPMKILSNRN